MGERRQSLSSAIQFPIYLILTLWIIHIFKVSTNFPMGNYGLLPREMSGAVGIFTSPFIHGSFQHLASNSVPLFVLTLLLLVFYRKIAFQSMLLIYVLTGIAVWSFARGNVIHIGASGVVYGLVSFVFWTGIFRRNIKSIMLALVMTILYSGYFLGVLPNQEGISWESHLFGGVVGIFVAYLMKDRRESDEEERDPWKGEEEPTYFLPRDTFDKTRKERQQIAQEHQDWITRRQ
ncbi:MAG: rhomboid family intramembrane serine protease [Bacteroidota bacterium]